MFTLAPGAHLAPGDRLVSPNGTFAFTLQSDGNAVLTHVAGGTFWPLWASVTNSITQLTMQYDGNLVGANQAGQAVFTSSTEGHPNAWLTLQDDGNLVIYWANADGSQLPDWATGPAPAAKIADRLLPGEQIAVGGERLVGVGSDILEVHQNGDLELSSGGKVFWASGTKGSRAQRLQFQNDGNLVLVTALGSVVWASNTENSGATSAEISAGGNLVVGNKVFRGADRSAAQTGTTGGGGKGECETPPPPEVQLGLKVTARIGTAGHDPSLSPADVATLVITNIVLVPNVPTTGAGWQYKPAGAPTDTLVHTFTYPKPQNQGSAIQIDVSISWRGNNSYESARRVTASEHIAGNPADMWRITLGDGDHEIEIDVDYGPDGTGGEAWLVNPTQIK